MRYSEICPQSFFYASDDYKSGDVTGCHALASLHAPEIEAQLEKYRPTDACPRAQSLLLHTQPVGGKKFCFQVSPLRNVDRCHTGWIAALGDVSADQVGVLRHCAEMFWKGAACPNYPSEPWEYRTSAVRISQRVGGSSLDMHAPTSTV